MKDIFERIKESTGGPLGQYQKYADGYFYFPKLEGELGPEMVFNAIRGGLAGSTVMDAKGPMMIANNTKPGFKIALHIKDLKNALETAHEVGSPLPITAQTMEMMQTLKADGLGQCDHSALAKYYEKVGSATIYD